MPMPSGLTPESNFVRQQPLIYRETMPAASHLNEVETNFSGRTLAATAATAAGGGFEHLSPQTQGLMSDPSAAGNPPDIWYPAHPNASASRYQQSLGDPYFASSLSDQTEIYAGLQGQRPSSAGFTAASTDGTRLGLHPNVSSHAASAFAAYDSRTGATDYASPSSSSAYGGSAFQGNSGVTSPRTGRCLDREAHQAVEALRKGKRRRRMQSVGPFQQGRWNPGEMATLLTIAKLFIRKELRAVCDICVYSGIKRPSRAIDKQLKRVIGYESWITRDQNMVLGKIEELMLSKAYGSVPPDAAAAIERALEIWGTDGPGGAVSEDFHRSAHAPGRDTLQTDTTSL
ncbi:Hypothetical Protein FCC1311_037252 [Hondaea fermentalgiana]|uniref:Uncharacterized protein n=1 Tax=Hondaea fermentalgiana TaxID=2315210 RepID=A0A2R5G8X0_9STRA|nr:Hypothetical Protein FCC1311_037252 [Hondaea fermentalgiana]|eukprot:GBG27502.1 Hypothetical Protein FCC1311_037252 [Hondaea fermentalgiana]